jgi:hypothetical protein
LTGEIEGYAGVCLGLCAQTWVAEQLRKDCGRSGWGCKVEMVCGTGYVRIGGTVGAASGDNRGLVWLGLIELCLHPHRLRTVMSTVFATAHG